MIMWSLSRGKVKSTWATFTLYYYLDNYLDRAAKITGDLVIWQRAGLRGRLYQWVDDVVLLNGAFLLPQTYRFDSPFRRPSIKMYKGSILTIKASFSWSKIRGILFLFAATKQTEIFKTRIDNFNCWIGYSSLNSSFDVCLNPFRSSKRRCEKNSRKDADHCRSKIKAISFTLHTVLMRTFK